jgi:hypothetical protein
MKMLIYNGAFEETQQTLSTPLYLLRVAVALEMAM